MYFPRACEGRFFAFGNTENTMCCLINKREFHCSLLEAFEGVLMKPSNRKRKLMESEDNEMHNAQFIALILTGGMVMGALSVITVVNANKSDTELIEVTLPTVQTNADLSNEAKPLIDLHEEPGTENKEIYRKITTMEKPDVEEFAYNVREAYLNEEWGSIKNLIMYPIRINGTEISDADEFVEYMEGKTLSKEGRRHMENETCHDINTSKFCLNLGEDDIWIADVNVGSLKHPQLKVTRISGIQ